MLKQKIELNQLITHSIKDEKITNEGRREIVRKLQTVRFWNIIGTEEYRHTIVDNPNVPVFGRFSEVRSTEQINQLKGWERLPNLPERDYAFGKYIDWTWDWTVQRGSVRGNLPNRIKQFYKDAYGIVLSDEFIRTIGDIAAANRAKPQTYYFEFVNTFDWQAGDFGDMGSCFWASRTRDRYALLYSNVWAVRFYSDESGKKGKARAWVAMDVPAEDSMIVFNGYGFEGDATVEIAKILADYYKVETRSVHIMNLGTETETIFLNGRGSGRIVANAESIVQFNKLYPKSPSREGDFIYDFKFPVDIIGKCEYTGKWLRSEDWNHRYNGRYYSREAYDILFTECAVSGAIMLRTELHTLSDGRLVSPKVWRDMSVPCHWCGEPQLKDTMTFVEGSYNIICQDCLDNHTGICQITGYTYMFETMTEIEGFGLVSEVGLETLANDFMNEFPSFLEETSLTIDEIVFLRHNSILGQKESLEGCESDSLALAIGDAIHNNSISWLQLMTAFTAKYKYLAAYIHKNWSPKE